MCYFPAGKPYFFSDALLLMEEILHHLGCFSNPVNKLPTSTGERRISSINSMDATLLPLATLHAKGVTYVVAPDARNEYKVGVGPGQSSAMEN